MTPEEVLKKVLQKADKNGWEDAKSFLEYFEMKNSKKPEERAMGRSKIIVLFESIESILFRKGFMKAFWGTRKASKKNPVPLYLYHGVRMLYSEDYLEYMEKFVKD